MAKYIFLILLLAWLLLETLFAAPYFLSYFNEFGGGVRGGYHFVDDSNYDWGQDLLRLQSWVNANPQVDKIAVDYFGGGDPQYYLGAKEVPWSSSMGDPADQGIHWLAVSVNTLELAIQPLAPGTVPQRVGHILVAHRAPRSAGPMPPAHGSAAIWAMFPRRTRAQGRRSSSITSLNALRQPNGLTFIQNGAILTPWISSRHSSTES